ncbi:MAG: hypothetical protein LRY27_00405, partial [Chitinophagales bacterium]|nr:hypothetical protein [Chitinophagales bacterium]
MQGVHEPPQSTPVSSPSCTPLLQVEPVLHAVQLPPQSTPVSSPSCIPFVHEGKVEGKVSQLQIIQIRLKYG